MSVLPFAIPWASATRMSADRSVDPLLGRLLAARDDEERVAATAELVLAHALPTVDAILAGRRPRRAGVPPQQLEDLRADILVRLLHRLRALDDQDAAPIHSFADYVAVVAYHRIDDFMRTAYPARTALGNRVRYLLSNDAAFALWDGPNGIVAGLAAWRGSDPRPLTVAALRPLHADAPATDLRALLARLFALHGAPVELQALVTVLVELLGVREAVTVELPPNFASQEPDALSRLHNVDTLRRLWREIVELPPRQRVALLLQIHTPRGDSVVRLLVLTGVATLAEIAAALQLEVSRLEEAWGELPLDDNRIAAMLGVARQQVINLRKSARERLARRLGVRR
jgi:hypothetical protein